MPLAGTATNQETTMADQNRGIDGAAGTAIASIVVAIARLAPRRRCFTNVVLRLRKTLGAETVATRPGGYLLTASADRVDVKRFEQLVRVGRLRAGAGDSFHAAATLLAAAALWRGSALSELGGWLPGRIEAARLEELRRCVDEELAEAELTCGRHTNGSRFSRRSWLTSRSGSDVGVPTEALAAMVGSGTGDRATAAREIRRVITESRDRHTMATAFDALDQLAALLWDDDAATRVSAPPGQPTDVGHG
jgi:hypothetical protein